MKYFLAMAAVLLAFPVAAQESDCLHLYYRTKPAGCFESLIARADAGNLRKGEQKVGDYAGFQPVVGAFAEIFRTDAGRMQKLLPLAKTEFTKGLMIEALWRAGLTQRASEYAQASGMKPMGDFYAERSPEPVTTLVPGMLPGDNDLLIGAYMASGNTIYIRQILENFSDASDDMAKDAMRAGLVAGKFGFGLAPSERPKTMINTLCEKYGCKNNPNTFLRVMTMASAIWALGSLSKDDPALKQAAADFFNSSPNLRQMLAVESAELSNYLTLLAAHLAFKGQESRAIAGALDEYEHLKPMNIDKIIDSLPAEAKPVIPSPAAPPTR